MAGQQDAVLNVGAALVQGTQQAFAAIAKGFAAVSKGMSTQAKAMRAMGDAAGAAKFEKFSQSMAKATIEVSDQVAELNKLGAGYKEAAIAGDKLTAATEKRSRALAKEVIEAKKAATAAQKTTGGITGGVDDAVVQKQISLIDHLNLSYKELIHSTEVYGLEAKKVMTQLLADEIDPLKAADQIASLERRRNTYQKLSVELQHLTSLYPQEAAALAKTNKSYLEQVDSLNKLKTGRERLAAGDIKRWENTAKIAAANEKERIQISMLIKSYQALFNSKTKFGASAQKIVATLNKEGVTLAEVKQGVRLLNKEFRAAQGQTDKSYIAFAKLSTELKKLTVLYPKETAELVKLNKSRKDQLAVLSRLHKARQNLAAGDLKAITALPILERKIQSLISKYDKLANTQSKYGKRAKQIQAILAKDPGYYDRAAESLHKLQRRQDRLLRSMSPLQQGIHRLGKSFKTYLSYMAASSVIFAAIQIFRDATTTVIEYDQALKDLQAITQSTDAEVAAMGETIKQVASDTKFSAVETAEGMKLLGQSGLSASESIETIGAVANLATGTLTDMDTTVDLLTTSMRVFDIAAEDSARISDVWANAVNRSKLTIDKIRTAMNYIGPVAAAVGISIEEVAGSMMIMANQGIRASTIGTGLRQVFRRLVDPSTEMKNAMAAANLTMEDMDPKVVGLEQVFDNLKAIVTDSGDAFRMFGQRGATAVLAVTKGGGGALTDMLDIVQRTGTAADMAATQMEGLGVSFKNLQDKIKNLYIAMGENGLAGSLRIFVDLARGMVDFLTGVFSTTWVKIAIQVLLVGAAATALGKTLIWLSAIIKAQLVASIARASAAMAVYTGTATAAAGATGLLTRSLVGLKAMLASTGVGLFVIALGAAFAYLSGMGGHIADASREFKALSLQVADNVTALNSMKDALQDSETTTQQVEKFTEKLANKYEDYRERIEEAGTSTGDLVVILDELIAKEEKVGKSNMEEQFKNQIAGMGLAAQNLRDTEGGFGFIGRMLGLDTDKQAKEAEAKLKVIAADAAAVFIQAQKDAPDLTLADYFDDSDVSMFDTMGGKDAIIKRLREAIAAAKEVAEEEGKKLGRKVGVGLSKAMYEAMSDDMLKTEIGLLKEDYQSAIKIQNTALTKSLFNIEVQEAKGAISHEAAETQKLNTTVDMYDRMLEKARWYEAEAEKTKDPKFQADMKQKAEAALEASYKIRLDKLKKFGKEREKLEKKLESERGKETKIISKYDKALTKDRLKEETLRNEHTKTVAKKRQDIEKQVARKIEDINKALYKKLEDFRKERIEKENETVRDLAGIESSAEDKILSIRQRGMTDQQKEYSSATAASKRYYDAQSAMATAKRSRDLEDVAVAQELFESSSGYYESLENASAAESGVRKISRALKEARKLQGELEQEKIGEKESKAKQEAAAKRIETRREAVEDLANFKTDAAEKLKTALDGITTVAAQRKKDHEIAMAEHRKEIAIIQQKIAAAQSRQATVESSMGSLEDTNSGQLDGSGVPSLADYGLDEMGNKVEEEVAAGIKDGVKKGITRSSWKEAGTEIAPTISEGVKEGIFDGVKVEGMSLEEWGAKGKEQGAALGAAIGKEMKEQINFEMVEIFDDNMQEVPVAVKITGVEEGGTEELITDIQTALEKYPGEPTLDFEQATRMIETFIQNAQRNYKITIPVQAKADGGAVVAMAGGGRLPGQDSPEDKVHVMARPGEWFIKNEAVKSWSSSVGDWFMKGVNWPNSDAGQRLHELLDLNGSIMTQNRNIKKLATGAVQNQSSDMGEFGTINFNLPTEGPAVPAMMRPTDAAEMMRQLSKMGRLAA